MVHSLKSSDKSGLSGEVGTSSFKEKAVDN